jgi:inositol-phosphate phosphatase/L-galactose 1-phosphate phosphatase/histidinol-phosphatase
MAMMASPMAPASAPFACHPTASSRAGARAAIVSTPKNIAAPSTRSARSMSTRAAAAGPRPAAAAAAAAAVEVEVPAAYVALAHELASAAGRISSQYFRTKLEIDDKNDASPVTIADREAEGAMRAMVKRAFPEHAIFGEEEGIELGSGGGQEWMWVGRGAGTL